MSVPPARSSSSRCRSVRLRGITTFSTTRWSPAPAAPERRHALAAQGDHRARLRARRHLERPPRRRGWPRSPWPRAPRPARPRRPRSPDRCRRAGSAHPRPPGPARRGRPTGPPRSPAWPRPVSRMRCSSAIPAGTSTFRVLRTAFRPRPPQASQGTVRDLALAAARRRTPARARAARTRCASRHARAPARRSASRSRSACPARRGCRYSARRRPPGRRPRPRCLRARPAPG